MIMSSPLFAESSSQERKTIHLLHKLKQEIPQALKISYNSTFELFKKNKSHCHWNNSQFRELMGHLDRQAKSNFVPVMSSELETLVEDFRQLDQFVTQQSQCSACKWLDRYSTLAKESLNLLEEMGGQYPENVRVPFPGSLYNLTEQAEVEDKVKFLILTSDHIISLMDATKHSVEWNTRTLQYFLKVLHRQSTELKECEDPYQKRPYKESYKKRINRHFRTLRKILKKEGGLFPRECLRENVRITFPKSALQSNDSNQNIGVAKAKYKIMEHIDYLFANDSHPESWNQKKVEHLQNIVYRIVIYDYKCIMERKQRPVDDFPTREDALKTYFDKLATLLRNKDYSVCAWEMVRKELLHVLELMLKLK
ncbi:interferon alpha-13-like protein [Labeo rohita]|uniref:Interferon alpha-13-like protein n=1 Tax=Labeo rohita TaxID=84645 RepID=A0A498MJ84_LABRO|nr:interferon alpha-13-like protein [Labeo rohita]